MKVLHFKRTMRAEDGGVVKAVLDLCATAAQPDHPVTIATCDASAVPEAWVRGQQPGVRVVMLGEGDAPAGRLTSSQLTNIRREIESADAVHLHSMWSASNLQVSSACVERQTPYVLSVHGMLDDWCMSQRRLKKTLFLKLFNRGLLNHAAAIHCTAQAELDQASKWIPAGSGVVVPLPLDLSDYQSLPPAEDAVDALPGIKPGTPLVLFLSRIHYKKGLDRLIEASGILHKRGVNHQLVVAGTGEDGYPDQMRSLAASLGIADQTPFVGFVSGRTKVSLLRAADLFALPTSQENFGFVYFEALASGTRVLTTKGTDTWPELEQSGAGTIVENSSEAFADAIQHMLSTPNEQVSKAEKSGRQWVFDNLAPDRIRDAYLSLYKQIAQGGPA